ncbi:hypothetical protein Poli38472_004218 [Pythium oligandrum]|uniref:Uncharacterized protein n=1 Tax=Pythium oligandrum TaxID=41045 RepID=A0A8K1CP41_PYTOL|nr:hypothetical protein Poli38472_004218 [Pythium oligandrum]|eukprot:TMW66453.1 hypothetical protein Poli38472_004218 [Pythium oligandrum]
MVKGEDGQDFPTFGVVSKSNKSRLPRVGKCPKPAQLWHLVRRLAGIGAALYYVYSLIMAGKSSLSTLIGELNTSDNYGGYSSPYIASHVGTGSIAESPLFQVALGGDSTPRDHSVYLESTSDVSYYRCEKAANFDDWLYSYEFMSSNWIDLSTQLSYNSSALANAELVAPVVDCGFTAISKGDNTVSRVFYMVRKKTDPKSVFMIMVSISTQDYVEPERYRRGAAGYVALTVIDDVRTMTMANHFLALAIEYPFEGPNYNLYNYVGFTYDGMLILEIVPRDPTSTHKVTVYTAKRSGFYIGSEKTQANVKNLYWKLFPDAISSLTKWQWAGSTYWLNIWGWTRIIYFYFAFDTLFNIGVLMLVSYQNYKRGKIWVGDAFVPISRSLVIQGVSVIVIWTLENFWRPLMTAVSDGSILGGGVGVAMITFIVHGDLIVLYISLAGFLGMVLRERIDPALVVILYQIAFQNRHGLTRWFPALKNKVAAFSAADYLQGIVTIDADLNDFAPYGFWSTHSLSRDTEAVIADLFSIFFTFIVFLIYAIARKFYRRAYPSQALMYSSRMTKGSSINGDESGAKRIFTIFELATGAELQNRFGVVADYDNCVYIKGMRYATPDGIYCNGFVIANGKWLIRTEDLLSVIVIIATGFRLRDVYIYEVKDFTVSQTARIVYPNTMTMRDLFNLNTKVLS